MTRASSAAAGAADRTYAGPDRGRRGGNERDELALGRTCWARSCPGTAHFEDAIVLVGAPREVHVYCVYPYPRSSTHVRIPRGPRETRRRIPNGAEASLVDLDDGHRPHRAPRQAGDILVGKITRRGKRSSRGREVAQGDLREKAKTSGSSLQRSRMEGRGHRREDLLAHRGQVVERPLRAAWRGAPSSSRTRRPGFGCYFSRSFGSVAGKERLMLRPARWRSSCRKSQAVRQQLTEINFVGRRPQYAAGHHNL